MELFHFDSWCSCVKIVLLQTSSFRTPKPFFATCKSVNIKIVVGCLWIYNQAYVSFPVVPRLGTQFMVNSNISPTDTKPKTDVSTYTKYRISCCQVCYTSPHAFTASALCQDAIFQHPSWPCQATNSRPPHRLELRSFQNLPSFKIYIPSSCGCFLPKTLTSTPPRLAPTSRCPPIAERQLHGAEDQRSSLRPGRRRDGAHSCWSRNKLKIVN